MEITNFRVNLLPPEVIKLRKRRLLFTAMRITLLLLWIVTLFYTGWIYYHYRSLSEAVSEKEKVLDALTKQLQKEDLLKLFKEAEAFVNDLRSFTSDLIPVYEFLLHLSSSLPEGIKLNKLETLKGRELRISGLADSPEAMAELLKVLKDADFVEDISLPGIEGELERGIPFNFTCRLKGWW